MPDYVQSCGQCSFPSENKTRYTWKPGPCSVPLRGQLLTQCQSRPPQDAQLLDKLWDTCAWVSGTELQIQVAPAPLHIPHLRASTVPLRPRLLPYTSSFPPQGQCPGSPWTLGFRGLLDYAQVSATQSPAQTPARPPQLEQSPGHTLPGGLSVSPEHWIL